MAEIKCFHCRHQWPLGTATTNRCPRCDWITEIYYDKSEAERVVETYNGDVPEPINGERAGLEPLIDINGFSVSFPDQGRLAEIAGILLDQSRRP